MRVNNAKKTSRSGNLSVKVAKRTVLVALLCAPTLPIASVASADDFASQKTSSRSTDSRFHYAPATRPVISGTPRSHQNTDVGSIKSNPFVAASRRKFADARVQLASGGEEPIAPRALSTEPAPMLSGAQTLASPSGESKVQANPFVSRPAVASAPSPSGLVPLAAGNVNAFDRFANPTPAEARVGDIVEPIAGYPRHLSKVIPATDARDQRGTVQETQPVFLSLSDDAVPNATAKNGAVDAKPDVKPKTSAIESDDPSKSDVNPSNQSASKTDSSPLVELATPVQLAPVISLPKQISSPPNSSASQPGKVGDIQENSKINVASEDVPALKTFKASRRNNLIQVPQLKDSQLKELRLEAGSVKMSLSSESGSATSQAPPVIAAEPLKIGPAPVPTLAKAKRHHIAIVPPPLPVAASSAEGRDLAPPVGSVAFDPAKSTPQPPSKNAAESNADVAEQAAGPSGDAVNGAKIVSAKNSASAVPVPPQAEPSAPNLMAKSRPVVAESPNLPLVSRREKSDRQATVALVEVPASADPSRVRESSSAKPNANARTAKDSVLSGDIAQPQQNLNGATRLASSKQVLGGMPSIPKPPALETAEEVTGTPEQADSAAAASREQVVLQLSRAQVRSMTIGGRLRRVSIANKDVCQAFAAGPNQIKLIGTGLGTTTLTLWADVAPGEPTRVQTFQVDVSDGVNAKGDKVSAHTALLNDSIDKAFPRASVVVSRNGAELTVTGHCDDEATAKQILRMVRKSCLVPVKDQLKVRYR